MKLRTGFVSNSSSSSFIIDLSDLSALQWEAIKDPFKYLDEMGESYTGESEWNNGMWYSKYGGYYPWDMERHGYLVEFYTPMDNFDMIRFIRDLGVPEGTIQSTWRSDCW